MMDLRTLVEQVLRLSGQPESAVDIEQKLITAGIDLKEHVDPRASTRATIQRVLEKLPPQNVQRHVRPGGESKFQWIF
jgi:hypothetical protein